MRTVVLLRPRAAALAVAGVLMTLLAVLSVAPGVAAAAPVSGACPSGLTGLGTATSPCLIGSAAQLYEAMAGINADTALDGASTDDYDLTANIDATQEPSGTAGPATSFGATEDWGGINWFTGTFNGAGYTISNLNYTTGSFTAPGALPGATAAAGSNLGFFRVLNGATVENLTLQNVSADNTATDDDGVGGVSVWSFASTVAGVAVTDPTIFDGAGGGDAFSGGLVGIAYANAYADYASSTSDGGTSSFSNDMVSGGSMANWNRNGGLVGAAVGATTIADSYVNTALSNPDHTTDYPTDASACYYAVGGLVGELGVGENGSAEPVAMDNNVISGSIAYETSGPQSSGSQNYTSPTVGCAATSATGNWTSVNNLVSSGFTFTKVTGSGIAGADGTSVSPATLESESTYSGTGTGLTDPTTDATYDDLAWPFGGGGTSATDGWGWAGTTTAGSPVLVGEPVITLASSSVSFITGADPSDATVLADAGAMTNVGTLSIDTSSVDWSTLGTYTATISVTSDGFTATEPLTIVIVADTVPIARTTGGLQASTTAPSTAQVLTALGATLPTGDGGTLGVEYPDGQPDWDTPGSYAVEVTDTGGADGLQPATATLVVVAQPTVTVANSTVAFSTSTTLTAQDVVDAVDPTATYGAGDAGTVSADISNVGSAVGLYTATITATDQYGLTSAPVTVTVALTDGAIVLGDTAPVFQVTSTEPSEQTILSALDPVMPAGSAGTATVSGFTSADFQTPGQYTVTVSDSNTSEGVASETAVLDVVAVSVVTVTNPTVYFNIAVPPTAAEIISASGAQVTNGSGLPVPGSSLNVNLPHGCGTTAGSCTATITGTDGYGFTTAPVTVNVVASNAAVTVAHGTATFIDSGTVPSLATLVSEFGATVTASTGDGHPVVNTSGVDWSVPGTYGVIISDSDANDQAATETALIQVVPVPVVTLPVTTIYLPVNAADPLSASTLLANAGATLTDGDGIPVTGTLSADSAGVNGSVAGTYTATISGTDSYGFEAAPVTVNVVIYLSSEQAGLVSISGTPTVGSTLTVATGGWSQLAAPHYQWLLDGIAIPGATSATYTVTSGDAGQELSVQVSEAPEWYAPASATSAYVTVPAVITVANTTATFAATRTSPSQSAVLSALGATLTGSTSGHLEVDLSGVNFSKPGSYTVTVSDSDAADDAATRTATIEVVTAPVVTVRHSKIELGASGRALSEEALIAAAGATLTDGDGKTIAGTLTADISGVNWRVAGTYTATITGTDADGIKSAPVRVTVVITRSRSYGSVVQDTVVAWTATDDVLPPGATSTTIFESTKLKAGTALTVEVKQSRVKKVRTATVKVGKTGTDSEYSYKTGKLAAGTTTIRFYRKVDKRMVLVRTETVKVSKTKK
jgi:hypothetical protein